MPIDKLVLKYTGRSRNNNSATANAYRLDFHAVTDALLAEYNPDIIVNGNRHTARIHTADHRNAMVISARSNRGEDYAYVTKIECNPLHFGLWTDFWSVIETIQSAFHDETRASLVLQGVIQRIDYACDYATDIMNIMRGLYIEKGQSFYAYTDMDNSPYLEHFWSRGVFNSFRIGKSKKVVKIYDKRLEEISSVSSRQIGSLIDDYIENNPEFSWEDNDDVRANVERIRQENLERLRSLPPKTRIEVSLSSKDTINRIWGRTANSRVTRPAPTLADMDEHIRSIILRRCFPFHGILINDINWRNNANQGRNFDIRTNEARRIQSEIEMGGFINLSQRWTSGGLFWHEHDNYFHITPWKESAQPSRVYRGAMTAWSGQRLGRGYNQEGATITEDNITDGMGRLTNRWPIEITRS